MMQCAPRVSAGDIDLQIIQRGLQVKTLKGRSLRRFRISLGFKQLARGLHAGFGMTGVATALLAAIAIIGISSCLESSHWVGVDFGRA
jgi:hypothetical protein